MNHDFVCKQIDTDPEEVRALQELVMKFLPDNEHFYQPLTTGLREFMGLLLLRVVLIQIPPNTVGRIHTDWRPREKEDCLALQIPLVNCENSITAIWRNNDNIPLWPRDVVYFQEERCTKIGEFRLTSPTLFRVDLPHNVTNPTDSFRKAISLRFKKDPWHLT
jgi:hypothetical protein